jgi:hypothetical protein
MEPTSKSIANGGAAVDEIPDENGFAICRGVGTVSLFISELGKKSAQFLGVAVDIANYVVCHVFAPPQLFQRAGRA